MAHAVLKNSLGVGYESLFTTDGNGVPTFVTLLQARWKISDDGTLAFLEQQPPPNIAGEWYGDPATSSLKFEPQLADRKLATDVVLLGNAYPLSAGATESQLGIRAGPVQKLARVFGERKLVQRFTGVAITEPEPFDVMPITYERCFGGWDRRHANPQRHVCEARNPVGVGFYDASLAMVDEWPVPNFEDPQQLYRGDGDRPLPAGFGLVAAHWQPRSAYAGTYDANWDANRKPLLPDDFDPRFFNAASPGLIAPGYLIGNEPVVVIGANPSGRMAFSLPGMAPPVCLIELRAQDRVPLVTRLDTVIIDTAEQVLTLMWRASLRVRAGVHDVVSVEIRADMPPNIDVAEAS